MEKETDGEKRDWSGAVDSAMDHVADDASAWQKMAERDTRKSRWSLLLGCLLVLAVVAVWDVWVLNLPREGLPDEIVAVDLRYTVQFAVEAVEDFRAAEGRLPTVAEISEYLDDEVVYVVNGPTFSVTATDGDIRVTYDGSVPLDAWMAAPGEPGP